MRRWLAGLACAVALSLVSCTKAADPPVSIAIEHAVSPEPARVGPASITLKLADGGKPVTGAKRKKRKREEKVKNKKKRDNWNKRKIRMKK